MKKRILVALALGIVLSLFAFGALAADVFRFESRSIDLFEGEAAQVQLVREGNPASPGTLTYTSANEKVARVEADGTITAVGRGQTSIRVVLKSDRRSWNASITVNVLRRVTAVTLNTTKLQIYEPAEEQISRLLRQDTEYDVIVIPAGRSFDLRATVTPSDASNKRVLFSSTNEGILKTSTTSARAMQGGECDLIISSAQNPEVQEIYHVLVITPVTKITVISDEGKTVNAGGTLQLRTAVEPANASITAMEWKSRNEAVATVSASGVVTGRKKGNTVIEARATDGSNRTATINITVAQRVTQITIREDGLNLTTDQYGYLHATVLPNEANDKSIVWSTTDPSIATVTQAGQVKGVRRGECSIIATSKSSPNVYAAVPVRVIQRVTGIVFTNGQVSLPIQSQAQLTWEVQPADATIKDVTFTSSNRNVATVDANGLVTGYTRGTSVITATATDGSNRRGQIRVTVTQPVEGVSIQYGVYHVQLDRTLNIKAIIQPSNANNQNVHFTIGDEYIATVTDQKNIGRVRGWHAGTTTITGVTEDGGYSASAEIRVGDFNRAIVVDDLYLEGESIRISLRNRSDFTVTRVNFTVSVYDAYDQPLVCHADGVSTSFQGSYRLELGPDERSQHYKFNFGEYVQPTAPIGSVVLQVTSWTDAEGYTRNIPEDERPTQSYRRFIPGAPATGTGSDNG